MTPTIGQYLHIRKLRLAKDFLAAMKRENASREEMLALLEEADALSDGKTRIEHGHSDACAMCNVG